MYVIDNLVYVSVSVKCFESLLFVGFHISALFFQSHFFICEFLSNANHFFAFYGEYINCNCIKVIVMSIQTSITGQNVYASFLASKRKTL